jgi:hypothetical protein
MTPRRTALKPSSRPGRARCLLAAALLAVAVALLPRGARASCGHTLELPAGDGVTAAAADAASLGLCAPFAAVGKAGGARCSGISVPVGGVLAYGTCALPGAACTGATQLVLSDATNGQALATVSRVSLNSSVAALSEGCVLGVKCSYGARCAPTRVPSRCTSRRRCAPQPLGAPRAAPP